MESTRLADNGSNSFSLDDAPNHKNETSDGREDRLEREEVATVASSSISDLFEMKVTKYTFCARGAI
jgi:hypothetical protein